MATTQLVQTQTRQDYVGTYTAYIYADGHVETDPAGRPQSQEDVQRARLLQLAQQNASTALSATKAAQGINANTPAAIVQQNLAVAPGLIAFPNFESVLHSIETVAASATCFSAEVNSLLYNVPLGGNVENSEVEFGTPVVPVVAPLPGQWFTPVLPTGI
jgi:hypothetical protein